MKITTKIFGLSLALCLSSVACIHTDTPVVVTNDLRDFAMLDETKAQLIESSVTSVNDHRIPLDESRKVFAPHGVCTIEISAPAQVLARTLETSSRLMNFVQSVCSHITVKVSCRVARDQQLSVTDLIIQKYDEASDFFSNWWSRGVFELARRFQCWDLISKRSLTFAV